MIRRMSERQFKAALWRHSLVWDDDACEATWLGVSEAEGNLAWKPTTDGKGDWNRAKLRFVWHNYKKSRGDSVNLRHLLATILNAVDDLEVVAVALHVRVLAEVLDAPSIDPKRGDSAQDFIVATCAEKG